MVANPILLARLARSTLDEAKGLSRAHLDAQSDIVLAPSAFGNAAAGTDLFEAHQAVIEASEDVYQSLVETLEADVDNLYRVAFRYKQLNEEGKARISGVGKQATRKP